MIEPSERAAILRFRVALVAVLVIPWISAAVVIPLFGWHANIGPARVVGYVFLTLLPAVFAWRRPGGAATGWLVIVIALGAIGALLIGHSVAAVVLAVTLDSISIAALVVFAVPVRRLTDY